MIPHEINSRINFIAGWFTEDTSVCDEIIEYHKNNPLVYKGGTAGGVIPEIKDSTDCVFADEDLKKKYFAKCLLPAARLYVEKYPHCREYGTWGIKEAFGIQHYAPGGAYHAWHTERATGVMPNAARHLVFMTYLNDVTDDGQTEWLYQELKVQPQKGLTVIWPADWTFTHRGIPSPTQDKWVTTGWFSLN